MIETQLNEALLKQLLNLYSVAEFKMMKKVSARVRKGITDVGWNEDKFGDVQKLRKEIQALMKDTNELAKKGVSKGILDAYMKGIKSANLDHGLPITAMTDLIPEHLHRLILETHNLIDNTTLNILRSTDDIYRQVISESTMHVMAGVDTQRQAAQAALNAFAAKGVTGFVDKIGRKWELGSYVEMATRTAVARAALQGHLDRQKMIGNDLVIVTSFAATCPKCAPWAGKVLSISGSDLKYPSVDAARSAGLFHPNCKHTITAYFPFIDEYDGHAHDHGYDPKAYNDIQKQRYNERQIRKWKRIQAAAMYPEDEAKAAAKVAQWQSIQRQHILATGLRRDYHRESIKVRVGDPSKAIPPAFKKLPDPSALKPAPPPPPPPPPPKPKSSIPTYVDYVRTPEMEKDMKIAEEVFRKMGVQEGSGFRSLSLKMDYHKHLTNYTNAVKVSLPDVPESYRKLMDATEDLYVNRSAKVSINGISMSQKITDPQYYMRSERRIYLSGDRYDHFNIVSQRGTSSTFYHEYGHHLDGVNGSKISRSKRYVEAMREDFEDRVKAVRRYWNSTRKGTIEQVISKDLTAQGYHTRGVQDVYDALALENGYKMNVNWGHSESYWMRGGIDELKYEASSELFANMCGASSHTEATEAMKKYFPKTYNIFLELLDENYINFAKRISPSSFK